jgi:hypothetical protein
MAITLTSPITGAAQTGLTSPTYTHVEDSVPLSGDPGKQYAVTALGGTQTGVTAHSVSSPFTIAFFRPAVAKLIGAVSAATGLILGRVPTNTTRVVTRKGVTPAVNNPPVPMIIRTSIECPAGADSYDTANIRAGLSAHIGALTQVGSGLGDSTVNGVI